MSRPIEDYALIGDCHTAALIALDGSIDWLCLPRFDSGSCFAALLGNSDHGYWQIAPQGASRRITRSYRSKTLILETQFETEEGCVKLIDCMPPRSEKPQLVRIVAGQSGDVRMRLQLAIRFDYGSIVPWVRKTERGIRAVAGPNSINIGTPFALRGENLTTVAEFTVSAGERIPCTLQWQPSHEPPAPPLNAEAALQQTEQWWRDWCSRCTYHDSYRDIVLRSLITLKALAYAPTGGVIAAPATSLPEQLGGVRNWDYRFCWVRDATFTLYALMMCGQHQEAVAWREWLLRAVAGNASQINPMYGLAGERRLEEFELPWLPGYEGSQPVRIGNAAYKQMPACRTLRDAHVLILDTAAAQGSVLDELSLLASHAGAQSVSAAVLLSRLMLPCEDAFRNRLGGRFYRLFHLPIRPVGIRSNDRSLCPVCHQRELIQEAAAARHEVALQELARLYASKKGHRKPLEVEQAAPQSQRMFFEMPERPLLQRCRRSVASGIALRAFHISMTDGMAPLALPELRNPEIPSSNRVAMLENLPPGIFEWSQVYLDQSVEDVLVGSGDESVWLASADILSREGRTYWVSCLKEGLGSPSRVSGL